MTKALKTIANLLAQILLERMDENMYVLRTFKRPGSNRRLVNEILQIIDSVTITWFTKEVYEYVPYDLKFQDVILLIKKRKIIGFIMYTCLDGKITMTLMAIHKDYQGKGYGTLMYRKLEENMKNKGFTNIMLQTIPPDVNANYEKTIKFWINQGFEITRRYNELWDHGAIEMEKKIV